MNSLLKCTNIFFRYKSSKDFVLKELDFEISSEDFYFLRGENGAGKSTFLKLLQNEIQTSHGHIERIHNLDVFTLNQKIDEFLYDDLSVYENCFLFYHRRNRKAPFFTFHKNLYSLFEEKLRKVHPDLGNYLDQSPCSLSGGMRQLLAITLVFLDPPQLLLLDEHTSALDPERAQNVMKMTIDLCQEYKVGTLAITHQYFSDIAIFTKEIFMKDGKVHF